MNIKFGRCAVFAAAMMTVLMTSLAGASNAPSEPTNVSASASPDVGTVTVEWSAPASDGGAPVSHYRLYRSSTSAGPFAEVAEVDATTLSYTDTSLSNGQTVYYTVAARNTNGVGTMSSPVSATTLLPPPTRFEGSEASLPLGEVHGSWQAPVGDNTGVSYDVYRSLVGGAWVLAATSDTTTFTDTNRALGHYYHYYVVARTATAQSARADGFAVAGTGVPDTQYDIDADGNVTVYSDQDGDRTVDADEPYFSQPALDDADGDRFPNELEPQLCYVENQSLLADGHCDDEFDWTAPTAEDIVSDAIWLATGERP